MGGSEKKCGLLSKNWQEPKSFHCMLVLVNRVIRARNSITQDGMEDITALGKYGKKCRTPTEKYCFKVV